MELAKVVDCGKAFRRSSWGKEYAIVVEEGFLKLRYKGIVYEEASITAEDIKASDWEVCD